MGWDVNESMVKELVDSGFGGVKMTRLQALAVFQHCSLRDMTLFEFFAQYTLEGMTLIPLASVPAAAAFAEGEFPLENDQPVLRPESRASEEAPEWKHGQWREIVSSAGRLECLRKHIAEVAGNTECRYQDWSGGVEYFVHLQDQERKLARVVEPVPTLGMVADDDADLVEPESGPESDSELADQPAEEYESEPVLVIPPPSSAEQADIAAVLANPKAAAPVVDSSLRKDAQGRALASDATLAELYACGERLGMNRVAVQELACTKFGLRAVDDLPELFARKVIANMKAKAAAA